MFGLFRTAVDAGFSIEKKQQYAMGAKCCILEWKKSYGSNLPFGLMDTVMGTALVPTPVLTAYACLKAGTPSAMPREQISKEIEAGVCRLHRWSEEYFFGELTSAQLLAVLQGAS